MRDSPMKIEQYLDRIGYAGTVDVSFDVLSKLQAAHLNHIPFENLDIHNGIKIDLYNLYDKIVVRQRGGFCYELNGLFYQLLLQVGFNVKMVSARVYDGEKEYSPEFDHMALIVQLNSDRYLVDVGFGEFALHPIKIEINTEVNDPRGVFRIKQFDDVYMVAEKKGESGGFIPEYIFSEKERRIEEFQDMCNYHQTNPASHFMQKTICSLPTSNGRISLTGNKLKITENGVVSERVLSESEITAVLWDYFGIGPPSLT